MQERRRISAEERAEMHPEMRVVRIQQAHVICMSVQATGLDENLNYFGDSGNASDAMVKKNNHNVWDETW